MFSITAGSGYAPVKKFETTVAISLLEVRVAFSFCSDFTVVLIILFIYVLYLINIIGNRKVYGNIRKYLKMIYGNNKVVKAVYKWNMDK